VRSGPSCCATAVSTDGGIALSSIPTDQEAIIEAVFWRNTD
jgi:hypothetical protein